MKIYAIFESVHHLMRAEKAMRAAGFRFELRPNPPELESSCGMCAVFDEEDFGAGREIITGSLLPSAKCSFHAREGSVFRETGSASGKEANFQKGEKA